MRSGYRWFGLALGSAAGLWAAAGTASIQGVVIGSDNVPVRAALILHDLGTPRTAGNLPFDRQFGSLQDGTFTLDSVPAGTYEICVESPKELVLDPCRWGKPPKIAVKAGDKLTGQKVVVERGNLVVVQVNDPQELSKENSGKGDSEKSLATRGVSMVAITPDQRFISFRPMGGSGTTKTHYAILPHNTPHTVVVESPTYGLNDEKGQRIKDDSSRTVVMSKAGVATKPIVLSLDKK